jgi:NADPH:quinone reductase
MLRLGGFLLGRRLLVTGASGGVGRFAVQLATGSGAHVTAVSSSSERAAGLRGLGAAEIVREIGQASGSFDLILESVGGDSLADAMRLVAPGGTIVTFGNSARRPTTVDVSVFYGKQADIKGFSLLSPLQHPDYRADLGYLLAEMAAGKLDSQIDLEVNWREAGSALSALRERRVQGKAVLVMS